MIALIASTQLFAQADDEDDEIFELTPFSLEPGYLGVTPGGAQDVAYFRQMFSEGDLPDATTFTAEGLFSEHDLPLAFSGGCSELVCIAGEAMQAPILAVPGSQYLAQIGFSSGIKVEDYQRQPLNLVMVIDKSGSMSGHPLALVKQSLLEMLEHLNEQDQLTIVLYGDRSHVHMPLTRATRKNREQIMTAIHEIQSAGSTNMEEGLKVGYSEALASARDFSGITRVVLFTDENPNVGETDAESFMGMARAASRKGVGLTTIGVGTIFDADLGQKIASVRGGNLFFFPDSDNMVRKFREEFTLMMAEAAYDVQILFKPAKGLKIVGLYGLPGDLVKWEGDTLSVTIETLFLSSNKGAIYLALAPDDANTALPRGAFIGRAELKYQVAGQRKIIESNFFIPLGDADSVGLGLRRGHYLVNEFASIQAALNQVHTNRRSEEAYQSMAALAKLFQNSEDSALAKEKELVMELTRTLAFQSGHRDTYLPDAPQALKTLTGTWALEPDQLDGFDSERVLYLFGENQKVHLRIWPIGYATLYDQTGLTRIGNFPLRFDDEKLILEMQGEEIECSVKSHNAKVQLTAKWRDKKLKATLKPVSPDQLLDETKTGTERDPVTGLPRS